MLEFYATDEQVLQIAANAVNASVPAGMGWFHYHDKFYVPSDFQNENCFGYPGVSIDYFDGRMVKLYISKRGDKWCCPNEVADKEYQSWANVYPTFRDLVLSVIPANKILEPVIKAS